MNMSTFAEKKTQRLARTISDNLSWYMNITVRVSNKELAKKSGVSESTISQLKNDIEGKQRPDLTTLTKLSLALGIDFLDLVTEKKIVEAKEA
ncbi:helix-turn-helix domain-containing protein [Enterococcus sp. AZ163]|uniref:helix-turn-helix domain-containing protein n=1 Tax=Enterococcus sp. AZ163 TaxID=2774638 RepID=UPI003D27B459